MERKLKREADHLTHSKPGSIDQQSEDSFPTSDAPSFSPGAVGAPEERKTKPVKGTSRAVKEAAQKVKSGEARKPDAV